MAAGFTIASAFSCLLLLSVLDTEAIRCYECSSNTDPKGQDLCGAYTKFDKEHSIPIDCSSGESHVPGTFCLKLTQQGRRGFIWDGRWRQVIRRCASVATTGVTGVCNWGVDENGVYWEECYCSEDSCNDASALPSFSMITVLLLAATISLFSFR